MRARQWSRLTDHHDAMVRAALLSHIGRSAVRSSRPQ
jgi:hypothetical protein